MDEILKQRIIGAIVLISCAVIFIPMIFDPDNAEQFALNTSDIPAAPPPLQVTIPQPQRPSTVPEVPVKPQNDYRLVGEEEHKSTTATSVDQVTQAPVASVEKSEEPTETAASKAETRAPNVTSTNKVLAADGLPNAWVVQVASFKDKERAKKLKQTLLSKGYKAFTRHSGHQNGESTRVYVGPKLEKRRAQMIKETIDKELNVSSLIIKFRADS